MPSTTPQTPLSDTNLLHQLDKVTQEVVAAIGAKLRLAMVGDSVVVPKCQRKVRVGHCEAYRSCAAHSLTRATPPYRWCCFANPRWWSCGGCDGSFSR